MAIENELRREGYSASLLQTEARAVWQLYRQGIVREIYFTKESKEAVLMMECDSRAEALDILLQLPLVQEGFIAFSVTELQPYDGFERLFEKQAEASPTPPV